MSAVCWHEHWHGCRDHHPGAMLFYYGRCRSGRRWFWTASYLDWSSDGEPVESEYGFEDSDAAALAAARAAVEGLAAGREAVAVLHHGTASGALKALNAERRRTRPAPDTTDAGRVEYLYGRSGCRYETLCPCEELRGRARWDYHTVAFRITKKTAKRIYYVRREPHRDGQVIVTDNLEIGYVDRQKLETDGEVVNRSQGWWTDDYRLTAQPPEPPTDDPTVADLSRLRREMADAHPDRGGNREAFEDARSRYLVAKAAQP